MCDPSGISWRVNEEHNDCDSTSCKVSLSVQRPQYAGLTLVCGLIITQEEVMKFSVLVDDYDAELILRLKNKESVESICLKSFGRPRRLIVLHPLKRYKVLSIIHTHP